MSCLYCVHDYELKNLLLLLLLDDGAGSLGKIEALAKK
jgi:hypothetical protein